MISADTTTSTVHSMVLREDGGPAPGTAPSNTAMYIGIGVGVGALILLICITIVIRIMFKRTATRNAISAMEQGVSTVRPHRLEMADAHGGHGGWGALSSTETISDPDATAANQNKRKRAASAVQPDDFKRRNLPWTRKHLSAIIESPRVPSMQQSALNWSLEAQHAVSRASASNVANACPAFTTHQSSPLAHAQPKPKLTIVTRSASAGILPPSLADCDVFGSATSVDPSPLRVRSLSMGAPMTSPPSGPMPPLPTPSPRTSGLMLPHDVSLSRMSFSSSSNHSASSSVLMPSPVVDRPSMDQPLSVRQLVEAKEHAELQHVANSRVCGPRPYMRVRKTRGHVVESSGGESGPRRSSSSSSSASSSNSRVDRLSVPQICSAERVCLSRVSSSNSLLHSGRGVQKLMTPTRRPKRTSTVSATGSPSEKRRASILHEVSVNIGGHSPVREPSSSTLLSRSSSNGNPFHWDNVSVSTASTSASKPSALKGSPNARRGHRRQHCVRISTLTPQVLGPECDSRSRSVSPTGLMHRIKEERESDEIHRHADDLVTPTDEHPSFLLARGGRAPHANALDASNLRVQTLRASLTPSSPTLSTWTAYVHENDAATAPAPAFGRRQPSSGCISLSSERGVHSRQQSDRSSFHIPRFPSPAHKAAASISPVQRDPAASPEFVAVSPLDSRSSGRSNSSPDAHDRSPVSSEAETPTDMPSSPPLPTSKSQEYDPAWNRFSFAPPSPSAAYDEYDPASPPSRPDTHAHAHARSSSTFLPVAIINFDSFGELAFASRPSSHVGGPDSPPCSPKTTLHPRPSPSCPPVVPLKNPTRAHRTSQPASSLQQQQQPINFPGTNLPVLAPPGSAFTDDDDDSDDSDASDTTHSAAYHRTREPLARRPSLSTIPQSSSPPPPAPPPTTSTSPSPRGPRAHPAPSVIKNVTALRRMNSDLHACTATTTTTTNSSSSSRAASRASRTYVRLGREPSPLLPWNDEDDDDDDDDDRAVPRPALDELADAAAVARWERDLEGALRGFAREWEEAVDDKENFAPSSSSPRWRVERPASVCDDGGDAATANPSLLSTPASKLRQEVVGSDPATPRSLYDGTGFLKA